MNFFHEIFHPFVALSFTVITVIWLSLNVSWIFFDPGNHQDQQETHQLEALVSSLGEHGEIQGDSRKHSMYEEEFTIQCRRSVSEKQKRGMAPPNPLYSRLKNNWVTQLWNQWGINLELGPVRRQWNKPSPQGRSIKKNPLVLYPK